MANLSHNSTLGVLCSSPHLPCSPLPGTLPAIQEIQPAIIALQPKHACLLHCQGHENVAEPLGEDD